MRILLVEDEQTLANLIKEGLEDEGYSVDIAYNGEDGLIMALSGSFDLIILDLMLPIMDGFEVLRLLREKGVNTPVLILTAKGEIEDKVKGLNTGADDYLTKPFSFDELLARIKVLTRRNFGVSTNKITIGDLEINLDTHEVKRDSKTIELTAKEYALLEYLALNRNRVISREQIMEHIYDFESDPDSNVVDVMIARLRKKVDRGFEKKLIQTVRGIGYILKE